jgi:hypothetical protein
MAIDLDEKFIDLSSQIIFRIKDRCMSYNKCSNVYQKQKKSFRRKILHILNKFFKVFNYGTLYLHTRIEWLLSLSYSIYVGSDWCKNLSVRCFSNRTGFFYSEVSPSKTKQNLTNRTVDKS